MSRVHTKPLQGQNVAEGRWYLPTGLANSLRRMLANQQSGSSHVTSLRWPATIINYATFVQDQTTFWGTTKKMETAIFFIFSVLFVVVYFVFSVHAFFMEKIAEQNRLFSIFLKKSKQVILFCNFLHEKCIDRKNKVHHDKEHEKTKKMVVFIFSIDPQKVV